MSEMSEKMRGVEGPRQEIINLNQAGNATGAATSVPAPTGSRRNQNV